MLRGMGTLYCSALHCKNNKIPPNKWLNLVQVLKKWSFFLILHSVKPVSRLFLIPMIASSKSTTRFSDMAQTGFCFFCFFAVCRPNNNLPCSWHALSSQEACTSISAIIPRKVRCTTFRSRLLAFEMTTTVTPNGKREQRRKSKVCLAFLFCERDTSGLWSASSVDHALGSLFILRAGSEHSWVQWSTARASTRPDLPLRFLLQPMWAAYQQCNYRLVLYYSVQNSAWSEVCVMLHNQVQSRMGAEEQPT